MGDFQIEFGVVDLCSDSDCRKTQYLSGHAGFPGQAHGSGDGREKIGLQRGQVYQAKGFSTGEAAEASAEVLAEALAEPEADS